MDDLISVIVPVYNGEKYLIDSLDSVLNQTYKNLEIILVDDGSTDGSLDILKHYEKIDYRVKVLTRKNGGICMAMKLGVMISKGKYIARHDCDDINSLDRYEKQLEYLKNNDCDLIGCYLKGFGNGNKQYMRVMETLNIPILNEQDQFMRAYLGKFINGGAIFGKSELFKEISPFHKDYGIIEDRLIYLGFHNKGCKIGMIEEELYYYRVHGSNTSLIGDSHKTIPLLHTELLFKYLFKDIINNYENIIVIQESNKIDLIVNTLKENDNAIFINEYMFMRLMNEDIYSFDPQKTVLFIGSLFIDSSIEFLNKLGYEHLENLFFII